MSRRDTVCTYCAISYESTRCQCTLSFRFFILAKDVGGVQEVGSAAPSAARGGAEVDAKPIRLVVTRKTWGEEERGKRKWGKGVWGRMGRCAWGGKGHSNPPWRRRVFKRQGVSYGLPGCRVLQHVHTAHDAPRGTVLAKRAHPRILSVWHSTESERRFVRA